MVNKTKTQCGDLILVDSFESHGIPVQVYVLDNKRSIKQYCYDTHLSFKNALNNIFEQR